MSSSPSDPAIVELNPQRAALPDQERLVVAISARALFDLEDSHALFENEGIEAYASYQRSRENQPLEPGMAFPLVKKLLALDALGRPGVPRVEIILLSRNSADTGLRIFNSIERCELGIVRAAFTSGAPVWPYIRPFGAHLFLSANPESVRGSLDNGVAAATLLPARATRPIDTQLRVAFDGDAVIFGDESERISQEDGLEAFARNERAMAETPLSAGPFRGFLHALHQIQEAFPSEESPLRTALVTARSAPAHKRVILTLRHWGVRLDEALFLGGRDKGPFLEAFG
ncbi:MAG TPA: 5'-nucleotidase, partial [Chiayiivirga sp.]|nr:5'-nucleotidase [Chiayiivirga sp.]